MVLLTKNGPEIPLGSDRKQKDISVDFVFSFNFNSRQFETEFYVVIDHVGSEIRALQIHTERDKTQMIIIIIIML
jgi:hypothetical protein